MRHLALVLLALFAPLAISGGCRNCHLEAGPPLWGPRSFNDGAGVARVYTLAGFIRYAMPLGAGGTVGDVDAQNLAAYIDSKDRPSFARKLGDYPDGGPPVDAVYYPNLNAKNPLAR